MPPAETCPKCQGTGEDRYGKCTLCGGAGNVQAFKMSRACKCGATAGYVHKAGPNNSARCALCWEFVYCPPKTETGEEVRSIKSRPDLKNGQRERILERDNGFCQLCGASASSGVILHIAHALSVADAKFLAVSEEVYMDDSNLFAACEECNLGLRAQSLSPVLMAKLLYARVNRFKNGWGR